MKICTKCGREAKEVNSSCPRCSGKLITIEPGRRSRTITVIASYRLATIALMVPSFGNLALHFNIQWVLVPIIALAGAAGIGLFLCRKWGEYLNTVFTVLDLLTILIVFTLYLMDGDISLPFPGMSLGKVLIMMLIMSAAEYVSYVLLNRYKKIFV